MSSISIIIPVLNEAKGITRLLQHLINNASAHVLEILVIDGGSEDSTPKLVESFSKKTSHNIQLIHSKKGRAQQMNVGANHANGNILYFLHADTYPPKYFDTKIVQKLTFKYDAGCFRMKFDSNHFLLKASAWFTRFNLKICRGGDQSLYIKKEVFAGLNGFNENYIVYEDCELISRIYKAYYFGIIPDYVVTSARKYNTNGTWKLQYHFAMIHLKKWLGASPQTLLTYYQQHITI